MPQGGMVAGTPFGKTVTLGASGLQEVTFTSPWPKRFHPEQVGPEDASIPARVYPSFARAVTFKAGAAAMTVDVNRTGNKVVLPNGVEHSISGIIRSLVIQGANGNVCEISASLAS